jgi:hypothetical protein
MTYLIRPIAFETEVPSINEILNMVKENTSQEVFIKERELKDQYSISLSNFPNDLLNFQINKKEIVISGYPENAPALCEILYTVLIHLGGLQTSSLSLLELPITEKEINDLNSKARRNINAVGVFIWLYILAGIALFFGVIYLLFSWL